MIWAALFPEHVTAEYQTVPDFLVSTYIKHDRVNKLFFIICIGDIWETNLISAFLRAG